MKFSRIYGEYISGIKIRCNEKNRVIMLSSTGYPQNFSDMVGRHWRRLERIGDTASKLDSSRV
jgi:hypothetical protein